MTGTVAHMSNYPNGFAGGLSVDGLPQARGHAGKVLYVGDGDTAGTTPAYPNRKGASDGNKGTFLDPLKTLDKAVELAVDARGDTIVLLPGYLETISTAVAVDKANLLIIGEGVGNDRPQLTPGAIDDCFDIEADNVVFANLYINEAGAERTAGAALVDVVGAGFQMVGCHADLGAHDDILVTVTASGETPTFKGNKFVVTADGTESVVDIEGVVDNPIFVDNVVVNSVANLDEGFVDMEAVAVTNALFEGNKMLGGGSLKVGTADVGTVYGDAVSRPIEVTTVASEVTAANDETFKPAINGNVDIHGVWFVYSAPDDTGNDVIVSTETGISLIAQTETETASVAGDGWYAQGQNSVCVVDEAGTAETVMMSNPVRVTGAAAAENLIDVVFAGGTEGHGTLYVAWSPADDLTTSEVAAS